MDMSDPNPEESAVSGLDTQTDEPQTDQGPSDEDQSDEAPSDETATANE